MDFLTGVGALARLLVGTIVLVGAVMMVMSHISAWRRFDAGRDGSARDQDSLDRDDLASMETTKNADLASVRDDDAPERSPNGDHTKLGSNGSHHELLEGEDSEAAIEEAVKQVKGTEKGSPYVVDDESVRRHYLRQAIQRTLTSGLIAVIGLLFIASYFVTNPTWLAWGLFSVVILVLVVFTSAMADALRTQFFYQRNDQGFRKARQELINEYQRLKAKERRRKSATKLDQGDKN